MKPIERIFEILWNQQLKDGWHGLPWDQLKEMGHVDSMRDHRSVIRAALLALAEMELSDELIDAALMSIGEEEVRFMPIGDARKAPIYFRAILRNLIEEPERSAGDEVEAEQHKGSLTHEK